MDDESAPVAPGTEDDAPLAVPAELLEFLENSVGGGLIGVGHYDRDSVAIETRDAATGYAADDIEEVIDDLRLQDIARPAQEEIYGEGSLYCTVRAFDDAIVLHFIQDEEHGTAVWLAPSVAPGMTEFIAGVLDILEESSDQEVARAPHWSRE